MYNVSENFKHAVKSQNRKSSIYGTLTTTSGTEYPLNDSNFIKDSLYITNQIVNNSKLCFGAVNLATFPCKYFFGEIKEDTFKCSSPKLTLKLIDGDTRYYNLSLKLEG